MLSHMGGPGITPQDNTGLQWYNEERVVKKQNRQLKQDCSSSSCANDKVLEYPNPPPSTMCSFRIHSMCLPKSSKMKSKKHCSVQTSTATVPQTAKEKERKETRKEQ
uniref:Uncharacterized protein n=1 Tax=Alectorobius mimon TaxID=360319 RepID=A0A147B6K7_9ACAR